MLDQYDKKPEDGYKDLIKIEAAEGLSAILGLRNVKKCPIILPFRKRRSRTSKNSSIASPKRLRSTSATPIASRSSSSASMRHARDGPSRACS